MNIYKIFLSADTRTGILYQEFAGHKLFKPHEGLVFTKKMWLFCTESKKYIKRKVRVRVVKVEKKIVKVEVF